MKKLLIILFVCSNIHLHAQTYQELSDKTWSFFEAGDLKNALLFAEKALKQAEKEFGINSTEYPGAMLELAYLYEVNDMKDKAESNYLESLTLSEKYNGVKSENYVFGLEMTGHFYNQKGDYAKAEKYYRMNLDAVYNFFGENSAEFAYALANLGSFLALNGNYKDAVPLHRQSLAIYEKIVGKNDVEYAKEQIQLALSLQWCGKLSEAEQLFLYAYPVIEKKGGNPNKELANLTNYIGNLYTDMALFTKAETYYIKSLDLRKKMYSENDGSIGQVYNNLAVLYENKADYAKAEDYYNKALAISKDNYGENSSPYLSMLNNVAGLYADMGRYEQAINTYEDILKKEKALSGDQTDDYATTLNDLAYVYQEVENFEKALEFYQLSMTIRENTGGKNSLSYATTLGNLAVLYHEMGLYEKSEPLHTANIELKRQIYGEQHPDVARAMNNLASLYDDLGQYNEALALLNQSLDILKNTVGEKNTVYTSTIFNLGSIYSEKKDFVKAEENFQACLRIRKEIYGEKHLDYASVLNRLGLLYDDMIQPGKAIDMYKQSLAIQASIGNKNSNVYAGTLNNLAVLYENSGDFKTSEKYYTEALAIYKGKNMQNTPLYLTTLNNYALALYESGQVKKAEPVYEEANALTIAMIERNFTILSEKEKEAFILTVSNDLAAYNSFYYLNYPANEKYAGSIFNNQLLMKGMLLGAERKMRQNILESGDNELIGLYNEWLTLKHELSNAYTQGNTTVTDLTVKVQNIEKELNRRSAAFQDVSSITKLSWKDVQDKLTADDAVVEFFNFELYEKGLTDSILYCAMVLDKNNPYPQLFYLTDEATLNALLKKGFTTSDDYVNSLYLAQRGAKTATINTNYVKGDSLFSLIWKPLENVLANKKTIYYSPVGTLNQISFAAIPVQDDKLLSDNYSLVNLSSSRVLTNQESGSFTGKEVSKILVFGGIEYDLDENEMNRIAAKYGKDNDNIASRSLLPEGENRGSKWGYLPGTLDEVNKLKTLFSTQKKEVKTITGKEAVEESFKNAGQLTAAPDLIHIASHGFFFPDPQTLGAKKEQQNSEEPVFKSADNPLFRSGLLFAGANYTWQGGKNPGNADDGILTAYEVANMDLSKTRLVVLSACETGLGDIKGSEGVYGLQRAFKMAGVEYIIMSLWQVPDKETAEFMEYFYTQWLKGTNITQSFNETQNYMKQKYPPYYWAAFVLVR